MKIPLVDLEVQYNSIKQEIDEAIQRVTEGGQFILGPEVTALENEVTAFSETKNAVGVASGTDASHLLRLQQVYKFLGYKSGDFRESESAQEEVLSLPFYAEISQSQIEFVVQKIKEFYTK